MADYDLTTLDATKPNGATEEVAVLDEYQRETRTKLKAWAGVEHDPITGAHVIPSGTSVPAGSVDGRLFYHTGARELLVNSGGRWHSVIQPTFNYVINGMFTQFYQEPAPTVFPGWLLYSPSGTPYWNQMDSGSATLAYGPNCLYLQASGAYVVAYQTIASNVSTTAPFSPYTYWRNRTVTLGAFVWAGVTNGSYIQIHDGITYSASGYVPANGQWNWMTVTMPIAPTATRLQVELLSFGVGVGAYFAGITLVEGHSCPYPLPQGWQGRQGVLHFGHPDVLAESVGRYYGVGGYSAAAFGTQNYIPFNAYVHTLRICTSANIGGGVFGSRAIRDGADTAITASGTGAVSSVSNLINRYFSVKGAGWSIRVIRNPGTSSFAINGCLTYEEVPAMP